MKNRKIEIFKGRKRGAWFYVCTTESAKTCREAVESYKKAHGIPLEAETIRANFKKG